MKRILCASVFTLTALTAQATETGAYVFGNLGYNTSKLKNAGGGIGDNSSFNNKAGGSSWELGVGYRINPYFATELSYATLGKMRSDYKRDGKNFNSSSSNNAMRMAILGIMPVSENFELFTKLSLNQIKTKHDSEGSKFNGTTVVRPGIGIGATYAINKSLSFRGEYEHISLANKTHDPNGIRPGFQTKNANLFKAGFNYSF